MTIPHGTILDDLDLNDGIFVEWGRLEAITVSAGHFDGYAKTGKNPGGYRLRLRLDSPPGPYSVLYIPTGLITSIIIAGKSEVPQIDADAGQLVIQRILLGGGKTLR